MKKKSRSCSSGDFVAKHAFKINKSAVFKDKKKAVKRGEKKHKKLTIERYSIAA